MFVLCFAVSAALGMPAVPEQRAGRDTAAVAPSAATDPPTSATGTRPRPRQSPTSRRRHVSQPSAPERIYYSQTSEYAMTEESVLRDRAAWEAAWSQLHNGLVAPELPAVDFATSTVLLVAIGQRNSAGSEVTIGDVTREGADAVVHYTVTEPASGCVSAQMMTAPVIAVRVPRIAGAVRFARQTVRRPC